MILYLLLLNALYSEEHYKIIIMPGFLVTPFSISIANF